MQEGGINLFVIETIFVTKYLFVHTKVITVRSLVWNERFFVCNDSFDF